MLTCKEAEKMVMPYIEDKLSDADEEAFLRHIHTCPECREELEIYYTVSLGLKQLDNQSDEYDITGALEESLDHSWLRVRGVKFRKIVCYVVDALGTTGLLVALVMQIRMWLQS
ncbi:MAG: zf-HC2 domain-containing protein [Clostridiales bacterium]|nr:zf-HC2 domain-containing protein [Clostridiales bacterium]